MEKYKIIDFLIGVETGQLSEEERREFYIWLDRNPEYRNIFVRIQDKEFIRNKYDKYCSIDHRKDVWKSLDSRLFSRKRTIRRYAVAASFFIPLFFAFSLYFFGDSLFSKKHQILPGNYLAFMKLPNGDTLVLNDLDKKVIRFSARNFMRLSEDKLVVENFSSEEEEIKWGEIHIPVGGEYQLMLEDSTVVWLNSLSCLRFPLVFPSGEREVYASGEVYFKVRKDTSRPFVVRINDSCAIQVLGTEFNVKNYRNEPITTTLISGCVDVLYGKHSCRLSPSQQITISGTRAVINRVDTSLVVAWRKGYFMFDREPLKEMMKVFERWYGFTVVFENVEAESREFTLETPRYGNFEDIIRLLEQAGNIKIRRIKDRIYIR